MRALRKGALRSATRARKHRCPAPRCPVYVPMAKLACLTHWYALPEQLRRDLNRTFRRDDRRHLELYREAIAVLHSLPPTPPPEKRRAAPRRTTTAPPEQRPQLGLFTGEELHTMQMAQVYRQGDVLLIPTESIPEGAKPVRRDHGRIVLAYGEVTGHAHAILDRGAQLFSLTDSEVDDRFLAITASAGAHLVHEEHSTIPLPPGNYVVRRQREYAPEAPRTVAD